MGLHTIKPGNNVPHEINAIIEIPAHSTPIKYEIDKDSGLLFVNRFIGTSMRYPCDYGYIPQTLSEDGDPLDVCLLAPHPLHRGCVVHCRPIGMLRMVDESGVDCKILAVPLNKLTALYKDIHDIQDLPELLLQQIDHFFTHYKDLEEGKWVKLEAWADIDAAKQEILNSIARYDSQA